MYDTRLAAGAAGAAALLIGLGMGSAAMAQERLSFASIVGPTAFLNVDILQPWLDDVAASSNGTLTFQMLSGGSAAAPQDVFDSVEAGIIDIGWSVMSYNAGRFNAASVVDLPLEANDAEEASIALWHLYERGLLDGLDGVKVLGIVTSDVLRLHHVDEIEGLSGFEGARVRASGQAISATLEALGAIPVGLPITQAAESLARHVIDGASADWQALQGWQLIDVVRSHVDIPLGAAGVFVVMNQQRYDRLPDEAKAALEEHSYLAFAERWGGLLAEEARSVRDEVAQMDGHVVIEPSEAELVEFQQSADEIVAAWAQRTANGEEVLAAFREEIARLRDAQ